METVEIIFMISKVLLILVVTAILLLSIFILYRIFRIIRTTEKTVDEFKTSMDKIKDAVVSTLKIPWEEITNAIVKFFKKKKKRKGRR